MSQELIQAALEQNRPESALGVALTALRPGMPEAADEAREIGETLSEAWESFYIGPVVRLMELLKDQGVGDDVLTVVRKPLKDHFERAKKWSRILGGIRLERLARELRAAVRQHEWERAIDRSEAILDTQSGEQGQSYLGSILGSVENDQPAAKKVLKMVGQERHELIPDGLARIEEAMKQRLQGIMKGAGEFREREFTANLTQAAVDLKSNLPTRHDKEKAGEMIEAFSRDVQGILAVGFRFPEENYWPDITRLLVEFLPKELAGAGKVAGVEGRTYASLSTEAKRGCLSTLKELGEHDPIVDQFLRLAQEARAHDDHGFLMMLVEFLGGLRNDKSADFVIEILNKVKDPKLQHVAVGALGNIGNPAALNTLLGYLRDQFKGRVIGAGQRQAALVVLEAFGKITRNPKTPEDVREKLLTQARALLPSSETDLCATACRELLSQRMVPKVSEEIRRWAARMLTEHLWTPVQQLPGQQAPEGRPTTLGPRQKNVDLLVVLAHTNLSEIIEAAEPRALRFSGGQMALGEVFAEVKRRETLPLLDQMIRAVAAVRPDDRSVYEEEAVFDPEKEEYTSLDPALVLESLVFAVKEIAEAELSADAPGPGVEEARRLFEMAREGELPQINSNTRKIIFDLNDKLPKEKERRAAPSRPKPTEAAAPSEGEDVFQKEVVPADEAELPARGDGPLSSNEKVSLMKDLKKGGLLPTKRRERKVAAMAKLAGAGVLEAVPLIVDHINDKDSLVAAAAGTALIDFTKPPHSAKTTELAFLDMLDALTSLNYKGQKELRRAMSQINFNRPACRDALKRILQRRSDPGLLYELSQIMGTGSPEEAYRQITGETRPKPDAAETKKPRPGPDEEEPSDPLEAQIKAQAAAQSGKGQGVVGGELDRKRAYMEARRAWIAGGKKGPPPEPPK